MGAYINWICLTRLRVIFMIIKSIDKRKQSWQLNTLADESKVLATKWNFVLRLCICLPIGIAQGVSNGRSFRVHQSLSVAIAK